MSKQLSIYDRLCAIAPIKGQQTKVATPKNAPASSGWTIAQRLARVGKRGPVTKAAMSAYESAVVTCLDADKQVKAAELAYSTALENLSTADFRRNSLKAQLLLTGDSAEVQRVNEKYDLGYSDYPVDETPRKLGFSGGK